MGLHHEQRQSEVECYQRPVAAHGQIARLPKTSSASGFTRALYLALAAWFIFCKVSSSPPWFPQYPPTCLVCECEEEEEMRNLCGSYEVRGCPASHYFKCRAYLQHKNCWEVEGEKPCCRETKLDACKDCKVLHKAMALLNANTSGGISGNAGFAATVPRDAETESTCSDETNTVSKVKKK